MGQSWISRTVHNPEANFLLFSFLFNFVWEMWQMPFYEGLKTLDYMLVVRTCTQASLGDGVISVLAYWSAVLIARSRNWIHEISITPMSLPVLPILGTGLLPVLQWSILPLLLLFVVHRQTLKKALM